jgi:hypothetical protein
MVPGVDFCKGTYPCPCPNLSLPLTPNPFWDSNREGIGKNHALKKRYPCGTHFFDVNAKRVGVVVEVHVAFQPPINKHGFCCCPARHYPKNG